MKKMHPLDDSFKPVVMPDYDERLLATAPEPTREETQGGYNVQLLDSHTNLLGSANRADPYEVYNTYTTFPPEPEAEAAEDEDRDRHVSQRRFKRRWIAAGVVIVLAAVGGIVGGVVGSRSHHDAGTLSNVGQPMPTGSPDPGLGVNGMPTFVVPGEAPSDQAVGEPTASAMPTVAGGNEGSAGMAQAGNVPL